MTGPPPSKSPSRWRTLLQIAGVALLYYLTARIGRLAAPPPGIATVVWPPSGLALAALMILGNRVWLGIWIGAFLANNWQAFPTANAESAIGFIATGLFIDAGSLLQAMAGAALMRRFFGKNNPFKRFRHSFLFIAIALSMCLIGCTVGVSSLYLGGELSRGEIFQRWWTWWIGDTCGVLVITPLALSLRYLQWPSWRRSRWLEAAAVLFFGTAFAVILFIWWRPTAELRYPADLLLLPLLVLVAYRFTQREVSVLVVLILGIAVFGTLRGHGPYHASTPWSSMPVLQAFIGILSIFSITVGALIAERKVAGEALRASETWLRQSQRISGIGTYVIDLQSGHWSRSEILEEILGIDADYPHIREAWMALVHEEDRESLQSQLAKELIGPGLSLQREFRIVRAKDGEVRWMLFGAEMVVDIGSAAKQLTGTILDITGRKQIETELLQAKKLESIGRLAGGVAHDFNNLLTVINGYCDLALRRMPARDPVYGYLEDIRTAGSRAAELTKQLLAFSRKQVLQPKALNLNEVVRDSDRMLKRVIGEEIELVCNLDPSLQPVQADPGQLHQVIVNLAVNARDAMPEGGKLIIETSNDGSQVRLVVRDTGQGMDGVTLEHVFEPFFTTKGVGKGTGLGLATVYGIVQQSAGHIHVQSEIGRGTTFTVRLPVAQGITHEHAVAESVSMGKGTVLLVEDEEGVRRLAETVLEQHGYRVLSASNGEDALAVWEDFGQPVDLLVSDVVMPKMRGPELAVRLRARQPELKVLLLSGYIEPSIAAQALETGARFLQKPFTARDLAHIVNDILTTP